MVRIHPDPPTSSPLKHATKSVSGGIAQLGEHLLCKQGVVGSIPSASTIRSVVGACALARARSPKGDASEKYLVATECFSLAIEPVSAMRGSCNCVSTVDL
jgi:hypothetical protein